MYLLMFKCCCGECVHICLENRQLSKIHVGMPVPVCYGMGNCEWLYGSVLACVWCTWLCVMGMLCTVHCLFCVDVL